MNDTINNNFTHAEVSLVSAALIIALAVKETNS